MIVRMRQIAASILLLGTGCVLPDASETRFWLENMVVYHRFSDREVADVLHVDVAEVPALLARFGVDRDASVVIVPGELRVLPYPGGRHPRIGFLDGAIDPERGTKVSIFTPWDRDSYVVVDLPEAIWWRSGGKRELLYLAHLHIPTYWDKAGAKLDPIDWTRHSDGTLEFHRRLPNGIEFGARVEPRADHVAMTLTMKNGSRDTITGLDTQVCVLLKGALGFRARTNTNKVTTGETVACRWGRGNRYIVTTWEGGKVWNNARCPCMHSNPSFPTLAPGASAEVHGVLYFYEGANLRAEIRRRQR